MNIQALKQVVRVLQEVQQRNLTLYFDLRDWFDNDVEQTSDEVLTMFEQLDKNNESLINIPHACGTTACAMGYAGLDPWFRSRGLKTTLEGYVTLENPETKRLIEYDAWKAIPKFLDMTYEESICLFSAEEYVIEEDGTDAGDSVATVQDVIDRVVATIQTIEPGYQA